MTPNHPLGGTRDTLEGYAGAAKYTAVTKLVPVIAAIIVGSHPAAATHDSIDTDCEIPQDLTPLFDLLDSIINILMIGGVGIGTVGFLVGGIYLMMPSDDAARKGKKIWKYTLFGVVLLLSSQMIMSYLVSQLAPSFC